MTIIIDGKPKNDGLCIKREIPKVCQECESPEKGADWCEHCTDPDNTEARESPITPGYGASLARPEWGVKIKGDAGTYSIWAIDWLYERALVCRACGDEWVPLSKITIAP